MSPEVRSRPSGTGAASLTVGENVSTRVSDAARIPEQRQGRYRRLAVAKHALLRAAAVVHTAREFISPDPRVPLDPRFVTAYRAWEDAKVAVEDVEIAIRVGAAIEELIAKIEASDIAAELEAYEAEREYADYLAGVGA